MLFIRGEFLDRAWFAIAHFLQCLSVSAFPSLAKVYVFVRLDDAMQRLPSKTVEGIQELIQDVEALLLRLHEEAKFQTLVMAITRMGMNRLGVTTGHLPSYDKAIYSMFPRLKERGVLVLHDESARLASEQMSEIHPDPDSEDEEE